MRDASGAEGSFATNGLSPRSGGRVKALDAAKGLIMMKLGIVADEISRDFREAVRSGKNLGIERFEIRFLKTGRAPVCDPAELSEVERIAGGEGAAITALSPGLFKWTSDEREFRREMSEVFPRAAELAKRWNLKNLVVFGFRKNGATEENGDRIVFENLPETVVEWMTEAAEKAAECELDLLIEPEPVCFADTLAHTLELIERTRAANLKINHDAGNVSWMTRRDEPEELRAAAPLVANVHVKDLRRAAIGSGRPVWTIPGEGIIDYRKHFEILRANGYGGAVSLEPHVAFDAAIFAACRDAALELWEKAGEKKR